MNSIINKIILLLILMFIVSCKATEELSLPREVFPDEYRGKVQEETDRTASIKWEEFFDDPYLKHLIDLAISNNNNLWIARKNVESAQWQLKQAKWGNVPEFDVLISATSTRFSDNSLSGISTEMFLGKSHLEDFLVQGILSWEADIWGKIRNQKKQALAEYLQTVEAQRALQTTIVANVAKIYYNLIMLDKQLEISKNNYKLTENTLHLIDLQFESGLVTSLAQQQAKAQLKQAEQLIPLVEENIMIQENTLSILTGSTPSSIKRGSFPHSVSLPEDFAAGIPVDLLHLRPDVREAELALHAANANLGIAQTMMYPAIRITAASGLSTFQAGNWINVPASVFGLVGGSLAQPVINRKRLKSNFEISKISQDQAAIQFKETALVAIKEVSDALIQIEKLESRQSIMNERAQSLEKAVADADLLFESGIATYLEVITAQGNLLQSQLDLVAVRRSQLDASIELYRALGGGWH